MKQVNLSDVDVLRVWQTLNHSSRAYAQVTRQIPKEKLSKRIEELKYLTSQKNVPRLSLRKEVINLEEQLHSLFQVEKALLKQERIESEKVAALKKENEALRRRLVASEDKDLQRKVDRLSHFLAETLAQKNVKEDIVFNQKIRVVEQKNRESSSLPSLQELEDKLRNLRVLLLQKKSQMAEASVITPMEERIAQIEEKLEELRQETEAKQNRQMGQQKPLVKHTLLFHPTASATELPLPSSPKA